MLRGHITDPLARALAQCVGLRPTVEDLPLDAIEEVSVGVTADPDDDGRTRVDAQEDALTKALSERLNANR